ncbi:MAG: hypothetical protein HGA97_06445 [Chlorobiaceae bacterium]|nr:hypothetical protein [Chlorobiaceae bacterium]
MKKRRGPVLKWFTAFIFSPGVIFASIYGMVWISTNIYLGHSFKRHLEHLFISETGQRYQLDIGSLRSGFDLNSITLKKLALTPLGDRAQLNTTPSVMHIPELRIECPDLSFLLFRPGAEKLSMHQISRKILSNAGQ